MFYEYSSTLTTSWEELTHWKRLWCWEGLGAGGEGDNRGWDGWMASLTRWTWVWVNSGNWWWTGRPGMLRFMGSQRVRHDWVTELNWTDEYIYTECDKGQISASLNMWRLDPVFIFKCEIFISLLLISKDTGNQLYNPLGYRLLYFSFPEKFSH